MKRILSLVLAVTLVAAACSSSTDVDAADQSADEIGQADSEEGAAPEDTNDEPQESTESESTASFEDFKSPLQEFLGVDRAQFESEDAEADFAAQEAKIQEEITSCMRELGWEYTPVDQSAFFGGSFGPGGPDGLEWGSEEWVKKYGLGITTQAFSQSQVGPDLLGFDDSEMLAFEDQQEKDPNNAYVESLTDAEREAYYRDLHGDFPDFDETLTEEEQQELFEDFRPTGCEPSAYENAFGGQEINAFYEEFSDEIQEIYERVSNDPRIVAAQTDLTDCLAEAGHTFDPTSDVQQQLYESFEGRMESLWNDSGQFSDPFEGLDPESMTEEEINEILEQLPAGGPELSTESLATLAELQAEELELSADLWDCQPNFMQSPPGGDVYFEVVAEYEQKFLDENASAVAQFKGVGAE